MEKLNLTKFETKENNTEANWINSSSAIHVKREEEERDQVIRKYEIYINVDKSGQSLESKSVSRKSCSIKAGTTKNSTFVQDQNPVGTLSEEDCDSPTMCLLSNSSDAESSLEGSKSSPRNQSESTFTLQLYNQKNQNAAQEVSNTPHFIKYVNRNGKLVKIWECGICTRNFQHQYTLMRHLPTHTNVRNFICNECGKAFRQLSTLSQHRAIHSIDRPYSCETCNKSFNRISTLISHKKTHSDVKPFRCHLCNKGFHQKGNLRNHIYIHTNARPYRCSLCNKGFNQMSNLVCHTQKSHSGEMASVWSCHRCNMSFPKRTLLRSHELQTHKIQTGSKYNKTRSLCARKTTVQNPPVLQPQITTDVTVSQSQISGNNIFIPAIDTDAMKTAKANKEIPFAVLHFIEGLPLLVRIIDYGAQSLLRPANNDDFTILKQLQKDHQEKISVPVVAAVYQTLNPSGRPEFTVMSPKNIYKFSNQQQISLDIDCIKTITTTTTTTTTTTKIINPPTDVPSTSSEVTENVIDVSRIGVSSFYETLVSVKSEPLILEENDVFLNEIVEMPENSNLQVKEEIPKAIAIVEDNNWKEIKVENTEEAGTYSEAFQNIATGNLLSPKRPQEECELPLPNQNGGDFDFNFEGNNSSSPPTEDQYECGESDLLNSFLNNTLPEDIDINILRNLISDSQKFLIDFDNCVSELFPS